MSALFPAFNRARWLIWLMAFGLGSVPLSGHGESGTESGGQRASGSLDFRIVIPPVMQILENSHPWQVDSGPDGSAGAQQRLVVMSNMKRGFCVHLRAKHPQIQRWQMLPIQNQGVQWTPIADGYRMCASRPGQYSLLLKHEFTYAGSAPQVAVAWPIQTELTAL